MQVSKVGHRGAVQGGLALLLAVVLGSATVLAVNGLREAVVPLGDDGLLPDLVVAPAIEFLQGVPIKQFVFFFGLTAVLAVVLPAARKDRFLSKSLAQDFTWFTYEHLFVVVIMATYASWLKGAFDSHWGHLTTDALQTWPIWAKLAFGLVLADFMHWAQHFLMHKVPVLWEFHKVHHSQREINFFTNHRVHFLDHLLFHLIAILPFLFLSFEIPQIYLIMVFLRWHPLLIHANIRTNLGPFKYVLVTPQSHRVHHSFAPEHHDMNYGCVLSVWDHLFGTQVRDYDVYPETGLHAPFPNEQDYRWWAVPFLPVLQTIYPFREIAADMAASKKPLGTEPKRP